MVSSTSVLGWLFLMMCSNSQHDAELVERLKSDPEIQQIVQYLRDHKSDVSLIFLESFKNDSDVVKTIYREIDSTNTTASDANVTDEEWYLNEFSK